MFSQNQAEMSDILAGQSDLQMINPTIRAITRLDVHAADSVEEHNNIGYSLRPIFIEKMRLHRKCYLFSFSVGLVGIL